MLNSTEVTGHFKGRRRGGEHTELSRVKEVENDKNHLEGWHNVIKPISAH